MRKCGGLFILFVSVMSVFLCLSCDDDSVDCPVSPEPEPIGDYNFYTSLFGADNDWGYEVYVYNTKAQAIVDSFDLLEISGWIDIEVTPNEKYLIGCALNGGQGTRVIDLETREIAKSLPYAGGVEVSANGKYIAIQSLYLHILDAVTLEEIVIDSMTIFGGAFTPDGNIFVGVMANNIIRRLDIGGDSLLPDINWTDGDTAFPELRQIVPTHDPNKLFLKTWGSYATTAILSYYISEDSTGLHYLLQESRNGSIALTADGNTLIFTDPFEFNYGPSSVSVFLVNAHTDRMIAQIGSGITSPDGNHGWMNPMDIAVTPDSRLMFFAGSEAPWQPLIDVATQQYIDLNRIDPVYGYGRSVACPK